MSITVNLTDTAEQELTQAAQEDGLTPSQIVAKAVDDTLFARKLARLRQTMQAEAEHPYTDSEIFDIVS